MTVPDDRLRKLLGLSRVSFHDVNHRIAITDVPLESEAAVAGVHEVSIDNFSFTPAMTSVAPGTTISWMNRDDIPCRTTPCPQ